jgi:type IV pilus assembly protein PilB
MILVTGPTGSGKTTTLYSALSILNEPDTNIMTIEDPVEYILPGINQVQAKTDIGLTFANGLRAFLRQDPDVIMVGEVRDKETGEIAGNAALTGHLVLATLHTNDAPSTVIRLLNMGIEPVLIAATLRMVIAQRLLRRICKNCKSEYQISGTELAAVGVRMQMDGGAKIKIFKGMGCDTCHGTGYKGRVGVYEVMEINEEMRQLIVTKSPPSAIRTAAAKTGVEPLREVALKKMMSGQTTIDEVVRVTVAEAGAE